MKTKLYPSDLTEAQWEIIKDLIPASPRLGRQRKVEMRWVVNAILYIVVGGVSWRMLPREYPNWKSVYHYFRLFRLDGTWQRLHDTRAFAPKVGPFAPKVGPSQASYRWQLGLAKRQNYGHWRRTGV